MPSELVINATLPEIRVALLEDGEISDLSIEYEKNKSIVGNVYKGRIVRVLPGMQAAFVDIGLERAAFLYVGDIVYEAEEDEEEGEGRHSRRHHGRDSRESEEAPPSSEDEQAVETPASQELGADAEESAQEEGLNAEMGSAQEDVPEREEEERPHGREVRRDRGRSRGRGRGDRGRPGGRRPRLNIQDVVKEGQDVVVQVAKEPMGTKGARLTCHISLPGRHVVLMPTVDHVGVSRKIESSDERRRLRGIVDALRPPGMGIIVRTVAAEQTDEQLTNEINYLLNLWASIKKKAESHKADRKSTRLNSSHT